MKILVVDDEKICRKVLKRNLALLGDCIAISDSKKALEMILSAMDQKEPYDIITLDISMPYLSGNEILKEIRKKEFKMKIPKDERAKVIMVTSQMDMKNIRACIKAGCNSFVTKPITKKQLFTHLEKIDIDIPEKMKGEDGGL